MKKCRIIRECNVILLWMVSVLSCLQAQSPEERVAVQQQKIALVYAREHGNMAQLLYGKVHEDYYSSAKNSPFWFSADWTVGSLQTPQVYYPELLLKYDAHLDALIFAADMMNQTFVWVNEDEVKSFWIHEKQFDYLGRGAEKSALESVNQNPGYFELLYEGKTILYAKREKRFQQYRDDYKHTGEFYEKNIYFLVEDQTFWEIKGKKDLIRFAPDHEGEIEQYIKEKDINFRNISDDQLVLLIAYCNSL